MFGSWHDYRFLMFRARHNYRLSNVWSLAVGMIVCYLMFGGLHDCRLYNGLRQRQRHKCASSDVTCSSCCFQNTPKDFIWSAAALGTQSEKKTVKNMEWVWVRPPPQFGNFSHIIPFFSLTTILTHRCVGHTARTTEGCIGQRASR